jgi:hypothetical protein
MYQQKYKYYRTNKHNGYDSKFEAGKANELILLKKAKKIKDFDTQKVLELIVNDYVVCTYKIDFIIYHNDGTTEYLETKGYATDVFKLKWKLFEALFSEKPNVILTLEHQGKSWKPRRRRIKK